jgi:hypothetical protein
LDKSPIKEYKGPALDYSCNSICNGCHGASKGKSTKIGIRHTSAFVKVASGMRKMKANIIAFEPPVQNKPTEKDFACTSFLVRQNLVIAALEWLRLNHADYADIQISIHHNCKFPLRSKF